MREPFLPHCHPCSSTSALSCSQSRSLTISTVSWHANGFYWGLRILVFGKINGWKLHELIILTSLIVSLKEMQENQFLPTAGGCVLSSTCLSALFKCPVVTEPPQHTAGSGILQPPTAACFLGTLCPCEKCPWGLPHPRVARGKRATETQATSDGGSAFSSQIWSASTALISY